MNSSKLSLVSSIVILLVLVSNMLSSEAHLSSTFYNRKCPNAFTTIRKAVRTAISRERRMAASLLRLHFHDCFVQGCDASVLLDDTASMEGEKTALQNNGSLRGFEVIDTIKSSVEDVCPGVVSCADILAIVARDASVYVGGPTWKVKLGRRDSTIAIKALAETNLPLFDNSLSQLVENFRGKGLSTRDMVALSGAHTIGQARCVTFRDRLYGNVTKIDADFQSTRKRNCPANGGNDNLSALDLVTPNSFDNNYFKNLIQKKGLLTSDQVLFNGGSTDNLVTKYSKNPATFNKDFANAMIKMGDISPLTGSSGQIRRICSAVN